MNDFKYDESSDESKISQMFTFLSDANFQDGNEFLKFDLIETQFSQRPDIHAFILLDRLCPGKGDMICAAEHDEYYLEVDMEMLERVITIDIATDLYRCGIFYNSDHDCFMSYA